MSALLIRNEFLWACNSFFINCNYWWWLGGKQILDHVAVLRCIESFFLTRFCFAISACQATNQSRLHLKPILFSNVSDSLAAKPANCSLPLTSLFSSHLYLYIYKIKAEDVAISPPFGIHDNVFYLISDTLVGN